MQAWPYHSVRTRNVSVDSENKIHSDAEAKKYGFAGGLVPGTAIYAHLTYPVVANLGIEWLSTNVGHLVLLKPAFEGQHLTVRPEATAGSRHPATLRIFNEAGAELARLETGIPQALPDPDPLSAQPPAPPAAERTPISWEAVAPGQSLRAYLWTPTPEDLAQWCTAVSDPLPVYRAHDSPVHPGMILQAANHVFSRHYALKPWIHTESRIVTRDVLRVGREVEVRAVVTERWEKKGHQFLTLHVAMFVGGKLAVEVRHSAIFGVRIAAPE